MDVHVEINLEMQCYISKGKSLCIMARQDWSLPYTQKISVGYNFYKASNYSSRAF